MRAQLEHDTTVVEFDGRMLARGGEAAIYEVPGKPTLLAKVYHKLLASRADKLAAMIAAPPDDPMAAQGHASIAWPTDRLFRLDQGPYFAGFVMPRVDNARPIFDFYNPARRLKQCPLFHYGYLLRTARNLAAAVNAIHQRGYVIGDVNESNILVTNQALVTLVDTDSFQVPDKGKVHRCLVGKPEYTPPELQKSRFADLDRKPEHDNFALAILVFHLLMQGMHPFNGKFIGEGDPPVLGKRIAVGHWAYTAIRSAPYEPNPHAPPFAVLPPPVQELMRLCFEEGHDQPERRPTSARWQAALHAAEKGLATCPENRQHVYPRELDTCPWCELARRRGRDPFPAPDAVSRKTDPALPALVEPIDDEPPLVLPAAAPVATLIDRALPSSRVLAPQAIPVAATEQAIPVVPLPDRGKPTLVEPIRDVEPLEERPWPLVVRILFNPAFWLIPAGLVGLAILAYAIYERKKGTPPPPPPIKQPELPKDEPGGDPVPGDGPDNPPTGTPTDLPK